MSDNAAAATPPPTADPQDPLPESNWLWRRAFIFLITIALLAGVWFKVDDLSVVALIQNETAIKGLITILKWALSLIGVMVLLYLVAPSAEQVAKMMATLSAWKSGISTVSTSRAIGSDGSSAEASVSAGRPGASPPIRVNDDVDAAPTKRPS